MHYGRTLKVFAEKEFDEVLQGKTRDMQAQVNNGSDDYLLNVNEVEYIDHLVSRFSIDNLDLKFGEVSVSTHETEVPAEKFPTFIFELQAGRTYTRDVIKYHIPFTGDESLLHYVPNPRVHWTTEVTIEDHCLCFEVINFSGEAENIKREADDIMGHIKTQLAYLVAQVDAYNSLLPTRARESFQARKQHLLKKSDLLASLGVPIKKRDDYPQTFAIPTPQTRKKIRVAQPTVTEKGYKPEPTLEFTIYQEILQVIHDVGKQFERMPATYAEKREEDLRDHLLLVLEPRFEGSATGETFNKAGKTDILLRYEGSNVFIAECKFWKGAKAYLDTITQLLGYLTWRDSKAAVVLFVQNKEFSSVIETIEEETPKHPNCLGFVNKKEETWLNYRLHVNGDPNREVKVAVLLFHIPPV